MAGDVFEGFDEGTYLAANPDVARAVALGQLGGALEHYSAFGLCEHRPGVDARAADAIRQWVAAAEAQPLPPPELRVRVHGGGDERSFADVGRHLTIDLFRALRRCGLALPHDAEVLDFGCGRAAPYVASAAAMRLYGCDIDAAAIAWSRQHLRALGEFVHNSHWPPLPFAACSFDFVYATSVFTHLPQDMEDAWLAELARVTCPGGVLLLTTHGPELAGKPGAGEHLARHGFLFAQGAGTPGLPAFYHTSYHTAAYIRAHWSRWFEVLDVLPRALNRHQDIVALRSRGA